MQITGAIGNVSKLADGGVQNIIRQGNQGDMMVSELHGQSYETNYRGNMFSACSQAVATTTVGLASVYTGLMISNPVGSLVNVSLQTIAITQSVIQATQVEAFLLATGYNATANVTHTAAVTPKPCKIGSSATPYALVDSSATSFTTPAPVYTLPLTCTTTATADSPTGVIPINGQIILMPGAYAFIATPAQASVAGMWFGYVWEEVPV